MVELLKPVTIKDIARTCGVHNSTVSRALRGDERITASTREMVLMAAAQLGYQPALNESARRMRMRNLGRTVINHAVGLCFPEGFTQSEFFTEMFGGVLEGFSSRGFGLFVQEIAKTTTHLTELAPVFLRGELDGLIATAGPGLDNLLPLLRVNPGFADRPVVALVKNYPTCASVRADETAGARAAAEHLIDLGHQHLLALLFREGDDDRDGQRLAGFTAALCARGFNPATHLHTFVPAKIHPWLDPITARRDSQAHVFTGGETATDNQRLLEMLRAHPKITGILALNDAMAIHIWYLLQQAGLHVPEEYSIIGFDDTEPLLDEQGKNLLTTVRMPLREMGQAAAARLVCTVTNESTEQDRQFPTRLIVRASTAPPRTAY